MTIFTSFFWLILSAIILLLLQIIINHKDFKVQSLPFNSSNSSSTSFIKNRSINLDNNRYELLLVQFIFRHGDRTPIRLYVNDPYKRSDFKEGLGELTNRGKERMFRLGEKLKKRYQSYLDDVPIKNVHARSSPRRRCLESCALVLAAMFPPRQEEIWKQDDDFGNNIAKVWQPIAINTVEPSRDKLLYPEAECSEAFRQEELVNKSPEVKTFLEDNESFIEDLVKYTGTNFSSWLEIGYLHNTLTVEKEYFGENFQKPEWIDQLANDTMARLEKFHDLEFSVFHSSETYLRLRAGSLLKQLIINMNKTLDMRNSMTPTTTTKNDVNQIEKHVYLYSTHDTLLGYVLSTFGSTIGQPSYGSGLIIELLLDIQQKVPYVRMFYVNGTNDFQIELLTLQKINEDNPCDNDCVWDCGSNCQYDMFVSALQDYLPNDIDQECLIPQ